MENKYYTPKIEEFHEGFEFEVNNAPNLSDEWTPVKISGLRWFPSDAQLVSLKIRVKYLDKKDVESLGWTILNDTSCFIFNDNKTTYLSKLPDGSFLIQWGPGEKPGMFTHVIFKGMIKNKSRLKLVMEMLGITQ